MNEIDVVFNREDTWLFNIITKIFVSIVNYKGSSSFWNLETDSEHEKILFKAFTEKYPEFSDFRLSIVEIYKSRFTFTSKLDNKIIILKTGHKQKGKYYFP